jgi:hypothetical protein
MRCLEGIVRSGEQHWPQTKRVWRQFAVLDLVMERMGVDPVLAARKSGGAALANARNTCLTCPFHRKCRRWLDGGSDLSDLAGFCPNAGFFRDCSRTGRPA